MGVADLVLGVDLGTTGFKAGAFDESGRLVASGGTSYALDQPHETWAEQPAERWWEAFTTVLEQIRKRVDTRRIGALAVVSHSPTIVPVGADGRSLRPAITWADRRATEQVARMAETLGAGNVNIEFDSLPRVLWIRDEEPAIYSDTAIFLHPNEYLTYRLTGLAVTVEPLAGLAPWTDERIAGIGLERAKFPASLVGLGRPVGTVAPVVASELGLSKETVVVSGTVDAFGHWIGVNLSGAGDFSNIGGTSEGFAYAADAALVDPLFRIFGMHSPFGTGWVMGGASSNSGGLLDWTVARLFGRGATHAAVLAELATAPAGSGGLLALPYFRGERTPVYDSDARGCFFGLTHRHGTTHMGRALLEGVAFGLRQVISLVEELGGVVGRITVSGGTARADLWNRVKADVTGRPVHVPVVTDSGVLGAAILARAATSGEDLRTVAARMVHEREVIDPDPKNTVVYDQLYPLFRDLYEHLKEPYRHLAGFQRTA